MRPNILFAIADDASHFSPYGHSFVEMPAADWVAHNGIRFDNAYTSSPKCAPSRATILTGRYPWQLEDACNHQCYFPSKFPLYPDLLEEAGYHMGYTGKGWGPGDYTRYGRTRNPAGNEYNEIKLTPPRDSKIAADDYAANFEKFLEARPEGAPFCFWYGCREPHRHYNYGEGIRGGKKMESIEKLPSYWPDDERVKVDLLDYAYEIEWFDLHLGRMLDTLRRIGELDNTIIVVTSDNGCPFPRVKGQMYEQDFHLPLLVRYGNGQKGRVVEDLITFSDFAPTFLEAAGVKAPAEFSGKSFWNLITSSDSGRIDPDRKFVFFGREKQDQGRENDLGYPVRCVCDYDYLYVRNFAPDRWPAGNPETNYTNCDGSPTKDLILELEKQGIHFYYNLCFGKREGEELYNIRRDPECLHNLAQEPACAELKEFYWQTLKKFLEDMQDPRIFGNGDIFESYEYAKKGMHSWAHYVAGDWQPQKY